MIFLAALWGLGRINLPVVIVGIALLMACVAAMHVLATPEDEEA